MIHALLKYFAPLFALLIGISAASGELRCFPKQIHLNGHQARVRVIVQDELPGGNTVDLTDKSILITGGTGSFGQCFVKTLLEHGEGYETLRRSAESGIAAIETEIGNNLRRAQQRGEVSASLEVEHAARRIQLNIMGLRSFACRPGANESVALMAHDIASEIRKFGEAS